MTGDRAVTGNRAMGQRSKQQGVVLFLVMIFLLLITVLAMTQVRKSRIDERIAGTSRDSMMLINAADTTLRWCEAQTLAVYKSGQDLPPVNKPMHLVTSSGTPAWAVQANWTNPSFVYEYPPLPQMTANKCLVEALPLSATSTSTSAPANSVLKFVVTARAEMTDPDLGTRYRVIQSELRIVR